MSQEILKLISFKSGGRSEDFSVAINVTSDYPLFGGSRPKQTPMNIMNLH